MKLSQSVIGTMYNVCDRFRLFTVHCIMLQEAKALIKIRSRPSNVVGVIIN